jgi:hypothetical protein
VPRPGTSRGTDTGGSHYELVGSGFDLRAGCHHGCVQHAYSYASVAAEGSNRSRNGPLTCGNGVGYPRVARPGNPCYCLIHQGRTSRPTRGRHAHRQRLGRSRLGQRASSAGPQVARHRVFDLVPSKSGLRPGTCLRSSLAEQRLPNPRAGGSIPSGGAECVSPYT